MINRRLFLGGLGLVVAAPAIVRASSLMQIKPVKPTWAELDFCGFYPAYMGSIPEFDLFVWNDAGKLRLSRGPVYN
jgi:hypothetical protein